MYSSRPSTWGSGSVAKSQSSLVWNCSGKAAGILIFSDRSRPPASTSRTRTVGSSESLLASTQPAEPAPAIT